MKSVAFGAGKKKSTIQTECYLFLIRNGEWDLSICSMGKISKNNVIRDRSNSGKCY